MAGDTSTATVMLRVEQEVVRSEEDQEVSSGEETVTVTSTLPTDTTTVEAEAGVGVTEVTMTDEEDAAGEGRTQVSVEEEPNDHLIFAMLQELSWVLGGVAVVAVLGAGLVGGLLRNRRCRHAVVKVSWQWMDE